MNHREWRKKWYSKLSLSEKIHYQLICIASNFEFWYWRLRIKIGFPYRPKSIYLISTMENIDPGHAGRTNGRSPGFYHTKRQAIRAVRHNTCDIWETIYPYAFIEEIEPGVYGDSIVCCFFKFDVISKKYEKINIPKGFYGLYSIG